MDVAPLELTVDRKRRLQWIAAGVVGVVAVIVIEIFISQSRHTSVSRVDSTSAKAIAVLPFQNAGSDKGSDFLRLALPDEIATTLSYVPSFSIRPFATTSKYNVPNLDLQKAGREMSVASIVTGHYLTEGNQLEITLEAVDVANNRSVWRDYGEGGPPMRKRSDSTLERALALDPNLIDASVQLTNNLTERGELRNAYVEVSALIKRRPDSAEAHFALAYVLR